MKSVNQREDYLKEKYDISFNKTNGNRFKGDYYYFYIIFLNRNMI